MECATSLPKLGKGWERAVGAPEYIPRQVTSRGRRIPRVSLASWSGGTWKQRASAHFAESLFLPSRRRGLERPDEVPLDRLRVALLHRLEPNLRKRQHCEMVLGGKRHLPRRQRRQRPRKAPPPTGSPRSPSSRDPPTPQPSPSSRDVPAEPPHAAAPPPLHPQKPFPPSAGASSRHTKHPSPPPPQRSLHLAPPRPRTRSGCTPTGRTCSRPPPPRAYTPASPPQAWACSGASRRRC